MSQLYRLSSLAPSFRRCFSSSAAQYPFLSSLGLSTSSANAASTAGQTFFASGEVIGAIAPSTNATIANVQFASTTDYQQIVSRMSAAKLEWSQLPAPRRGDIVRKIGEKLRVHKDALGSLIALEMGKILSEGKGEVQEAIDICEYAVGLSRSFSGLVLPSERRDHFMMERWNPLQGHVGIITAFNFPCAVYFWNLAISLVCGNTNLWKGSETTTLTSIACSKIVNEVFQEEKMDGAVASLISGRGNTIGQAILSDPRFELISFTGSTKVGRLVSEQTAKRFAKKILELGGNNAMVILNDADLPLALRASIFAAAGTAGQRCTTLRRIYVQEGVYSTFLSSLEKAYQSIQSKIGDPLNPATLIGPLHTKSAVSAFNAAIQRAQQEGGKILVGGKDLSSDPKYQKGNFVQPTLIEMSNPRAGCVQEEVFVPILYVMKVKTIEEAIALNNGVPQGLSSSLFTKDSQAIFKWTGAQGSDCGIVNVNIGPSGAEIGGAFGGEKETGGGRESGSDSWKQYMRRSTCTINYGNTLPLAQGVQFDL